jgi:hypothetical protein
VTPTSGLIVAAAHFPRCKATALVIAPARDLPDVILPVFEERVPRSVCTPDLFHAD